MQYLHTMTDKDDTDVENETHKTYDDATLEGDDENTLDPENGLTCDNPILLPSCDEQACDVFQEFMQDEKLASDLDCLGCCDIPTGEQCGAGMEDVIMMRESMVREESRKQLVTALETAGVALPIAAFETALNTEDVSRALGCGGPEQVEASKKETTRSVPAKSKQNKLRSVPVKSKQNKLHSVPAIDCDQSYDAALNPFDGDPDKAIGMLDDLHNTQLYSKSSPDAADPEAPPRTLSSPESMKKVQNLNSTTVTEGSDDESEEQILELSKLALPLGSITRGGVIIVETDDASEVQSIDNSKHALVSKNSKRVTMIFPKDKRIRWAIVVCCLLQLVLIGIIVFAVTRRNDEKAALGSVPPSPKNDTTFLGSSNNDTTATDPLWGSENSTVFNSTMSNGTGIETCFDSITTDTRCYPRGRQIVVMFENCQPEDDDWLGIWDANANPSALENNAADWMWSCGNKQCRGIVETNLVAFLDFYDEGSYRLHLVRGDQQGPFSAYASSDVFEVKQNLVDCSQ